MPSDPRTIRGPCFDCDDADDFGCACRFFPDSDIDDVSVLRFLAKHQGEWSTWGTGYSMPTVQDAMPVGTPPKLQLAKMRMLMRRGFSGGCECGCRGDFEITDAGLEYIGEQRTTQYTGYGPTCRRG